MRKLTLEDRINNIYFDKKGKQILEGDLLKVFHFRTKRKIYYMYQVAVMEQGDFPVMSGKDYNADKPHYRFYVSANDDRVLEFSEIIYEKDWKSKRLKVKV